MFKECLIINSYTLEASFYKSDSKSLAKIKAEIERSEGRTKVSTRRQNKQESDEDDSEHFDENDFIIVGKDFSTTHAGYPKN
jgi:hypothetical protein